MLPVTAGTDVFEHRLQVRLGIGALLGVEAFAVEANRLLKVDDLRREPNVGLVRLEPAVQTV